MDNRENSAIDFLVFSTFSFSLWSLQNKEADEILDCIIKRAYRDAASHIKSENTNRKTIGSSIISEEISKLKTGNPEDYNGWHDNLSSSLRNILQCNCGFAQKWVNMTMKYITLVCDLWEYIGNGNESKFVNEYRNMVNQYRADFHAPVDRYIINAAWKTSKDIYLPLEDGVSQEKRVKMDYKNPADYVKPWSQWSPKDYKRFYNSVRKHINMEKGALEWEGPAWIKYAEGRNAAEKTDESTP